MSKPNFSRRKSSFQGSDSTMSTTTYSDTKKTDLYKINSLDSNVSFLDEIKETTSIKANSKLSEGNFEFFKDFPSESIPQKRFFSFLFKKPSNKEFDATFEKPTLPIDNDNVFATRTWNILDKYFFIWTFHVLINGYNRLFQPVDLYKLPTSLQIDTLCEKFSVNWEASKANHKKKYNNEDYSKWMLTNTVIKTFKWKAIYGISCYIVSNIGFSVMPIITKKLISFVEKRNQKDDTTKINSGVLYIFITAIIMTVASVVFSQGYLACYSIGIYIKSVLTRALLEKSLKLSSKARYKNTNSKLATVATTDLSRIEYGCSSVPYLFSFPVALVIAIVLLIEYIGPVTLVGCFYFILSLGVSGWGFITVFRLRQSANISTDARISYIKEAITNLKIIKYFTYERAYEKIINEKRAKEISDVKKLQYIQSSVSAHGLLSPIMASLFTFLIAYKINPHRSPSSVFAALSLFNILSSQMLYVPNSIGNVINMSLSLQRAQEILVAEEEVPKKISLKNPEKNIIEFNELNVAYEKHQVLKDVTFEIKKNEFITILGATGSGKTTLLEQMKIENSLMCGKPWSQATNVRNNITFGLPFDLSLYNDVLFSCALLPDLQSFKNGDLTELGESGITLSGGQKARISLARACYKSCYEKKHFESEKLNDGLILLDDVMSALDAKSGQHVLNNCIMDLIKDNTRILVTHQVDLVYKADRIIFLNGLGGCKIGKLDEMIEDPAFNEYLTSCTNETQEDESDVEDGFEDYSKKYSFDPTKKNIHDIKKQYDDSENHEKVIVKDDDDLEEGRIVVQEGRSVNSVGGDVYVNFIKAATNKYWVLFTIFAFAVGCLTAFFSLFSSVWLSFWTSTKFHESRSFYMGFYALWAILFFVFILIELVIIATVCIVSAKNLHRDSLHNILYAPMSFMDITPLGRILNRFTKDIDALDNQMPYVAVLGFYLLFQIGAVIIMCVIYIPWFLIAIPFIILAMLFIYSLYQSTGREVKRLEAVQRSLVYNNFNEVLNGSSTITTYKVGELFLKKNNVLIDKNNESAVMYLCLQRWSSIWIVNLCVVFAVVMSFLCICKVFTISSSSVGVLLTYVLQLSLTLKELLFETTQIENFMNSVERLVEYSQDLPQEKAYELPDTDPNADQWPLNGEIVFENCSMAYREGLPLSLKNLNLVIKPGEKISIVGRSGAGKSTLTSCIYRLTELNDGKIYIDGLDISKLGLYTLRKNLSIIPQEPVLFKGTIRTNLDPFNQFTDEYLWEVLSKSVFTKEEALEVQKQKVEDSSDTSNLSKFHLLQVVEEDGTNYSNGEKQLLALARALVRNTKILILDEATSSVDHDTDAKIQRQIVKHFSHCTIITIAHRLRTILNYDKVLVLDKGERKDYDSPWKLFNKDGSIFSELCAKSKITPNDFERQDI
ncbi:hypothetical protein DAHU10_009400 [Hanseniaspora uvarum]|nr:hypothetical protein DAHU10_009400 [Hanseniaspora uvarum]